MSPSEMVRRRIGLNKIQIFYKLLGKKQLRQKMATPLSPTPNMTYMSMSTEPMTIDGTWYPPGTSYLMVYNSQTELYEPVPTKNTSAIASTRAATMTFFQVQQSAPFHQTQTPGVFPLQPHIVQPTEPEMLFYAPQMPQQQSAPCFSYSRVPLHQSSMEQIEPQMGYPIASPTIEQSSNHSQGTSDTEIFLERTQSSEDEFYVSVDELYKNELQTFARDKLLEFAEEFGTNLVDQFKLKIMNCLTIPSQKPWKMLSCTINQHYLPQENRSNINIKECCFSHSTREADLAHAVEQARHDLIAEWPLDHLEGAFDAKFYPFFKVYRHLTQRFDPEIILQYRNNILHTLLQNQHRYIPWKKASCKNRKCSTSKQCRFYHNKQEKMIGNEYNEFFADIKNRLYIKV